jgi:hypothetical protein
MTKMHLLLALVVFAANVGCTPSSLHHFSQTMANLRTQAELGGLERRAQRAERRERQALAQLERIEQRLEELSERTELLDAQRVERARVERVRVSRLRPVARSVPPNPFSIPPNPY